MEQPWFTHTLLPVVWSQTLHHNPILHAFLAAWHPVMVDYVIVHQEKKKKTNTKKEADVSHVCGRILNSWHL